MGVYRWYVLFSLMIFSGVSYSDESDYFPPGMSMASGTHIAYRFSHFQSSFTFIDGAVYLYRAGEGSFTNGYTDKGTYYTGSWLVISDEDQAWSNGYGEVYQYGKSHPETFNTCQPVKGSFKYKFSDTHDVLVHPDKPEDGTVPALTYDNCTYQVNSNYCPDGNITPDTICTATKLILFSNQTDDSDKPPVDGDDSSDNNGDSSGDSGSGDGGGSGGGSGGGDGGGGPVFPGGGGSGGSGGGSGGGDGGGSGGGDGGSGGGGGGGSGGGDGSLPGGNDGGGNTGDNSGAPGDEEGGNIFLPSLDIPELSLAPLWNIWPSARDFAITLPSASCPVFNIEVFGTNYRIDTFCVIFTPDVIALIRVFSILTASVFSFVIVLRA